MSVNVLSSGLQTTVQDLGRFGYQQEGIVVSGAMDATALRLGNWLVGNPDSAAGLEITLLGPRLEFAADHIVALTGADLSAALDGQPAPVGRPILVRPGCVLTFGAPRAGCRAYLTISGGLDLPLVLGSRSTYLRAHLGGLGGRALHAGDTLPAPGPTPGPLWKALTSRITNRAWVAAPWSCREAGYQPAGPEPVVRACRGPEYELFSAASQAQLWDDSFLVSTASDRMGYRLHGPGLSLAEPRELLSSAVTFGTVQVPADGNPIVLAADHQTTGGYPRIAQVVSADFSTLAQVSLGQRLGFREVALAEAQDLFLQQERRLQQLCRFIRLKISC